ncbi:hypothetical protein QYS49_38290 [Marivirga salinae]|uniref:DUF1566 domain-containing protein n=1 Tax=Marivirga salinarum TaxID=3059078 RepID=A0AA51RAS0_9BACT|nr:hypothetical protein [Marivirga sp. BDSF4-3]WMN11416.1 hypothetical protein QYS49_38290 [Marivirga sp. BDSF4-3]
MKNILVLVVVLLITEMAMGQAPEKFSFQAVIRNAENEIVKDQSVGIQISIIRASVSGPAVYVESHQLSTNGNGLVSVKIGEGNIISGTFSNIDWGAGPFFIKTETDPEGGENYTIEGISELLSVPFALRATTTDSIVGGISSKETDPIFNASLASGITESDTINWNNHTIDTKLNASEIADFGFVEGPHTDSTNIADFGYVAGAHLDSTDIANFGYVTGEHVDSTAIANMGFISNDIEYSIGDFVHGGIVFWLDETGQHGLVCAKKDQSSGTRWYAGTFGSTQAKGDGPFAGKSNTTIIIAAQVAIGDDGDTYAARICNELQITEDEKTYGDWYLPSKSELNLMFLNKTIIDATATSNGGDAFASDFYWSSTEIKNNAASAQQFNAGVQLGFNKNVPRNVRAIRAF